MTRPPAGTLVSMLAVSCYTVPTDAPEGDGTYDWHDTTMVLVEVTAGGRTGLGYSYTHSSAARLIASILSKVVEGKTPSIFRSSIRVCCTPFATWAVPASRPRPSRRWTVRCGI